PKVSRPSRSDWRTGPACIRSPRASTSTRSSSGGGSSSSSCSASSVDVELIGYTSRLSVAPGERLSFMVSSKRPRYEARLVRLIHGDEHAQGPGFKEEEVPSAIVGAYAGRV